MKEMNIVEAAPIRDQVADILRKRIISGDLANGEKLSERQISAELNISTTPVKEAFRLLQAEGLIYTLPRKGSFVSANASEHAYQVMLLRSSIDGVAAYLAAKRINDAYDISCELERKRVECAIMIKAAEAEKDEARNEEK